MTVICYRNLDSVLIACQDFDDTIKSKERILEIDQSRSPYNVTFLFTIRSIKSSHMNPLHINQSITQSHLISIHRMLCNNILLQTQSFVK